MDIQETNRVAWNKITESYQKQATFSYDQMDYGHTLCPNESDLNLIGDVKNKLILELGCGGANCGISLAKKGANVTCLDLSDEQLKFARKISDNEGASINFIQGPMEDLSQFKDSSFDLIISICAIQYVKDYDKVFKEVHRILKKDGQFVFSTDDPIFYSIASKELWPHEDINDSYFYRGADSWVEDGMKFITFRRPIEDYINKLINTGLIIERFH